MTLKRRLGHVDDIADRNARGFDPLEAGDDSLFVVRRGDELFAYLDRCPHQGAKMGWRRHGYLNRAGDRIVCHAHGAQFDVASGRCLLGPCPGQSLDAVAIGLAEDGTIYLEGDVVTRVRP